MNKEHLAKLQEKVNRLMRLSSEDSDTENQPEAICTKTRERQRDDAEPETVRKCI